jgi:hypothetical protein
VKKLENIIPAYLKIALIIPVICGKMGKAILFFRQHITGDHNREYETGYAGF